jgi:hypothetical protein
MKAKPFLWHYADMPPHVFKCFDSYSEAAKALDVHEAVIRYYQKEGIHSEADKKKAKKRLA